MVAAAAVAAVAGGCSEGRQREPGPELLLLWRRRRARISWVRFLSFAGAGGGAGGGDCCFGTFEAVERPIRTMGRSDFSGEYCRGCSTVAPVERHVPISVLKRAGER